MPPQYTFKIVVGGAGGVGKTTLLHRYLHGNFIEDTAMTIGVSFYLKELERKDYHLNLAFWDLGGQDRFRFLQPKYCAGAQAGIIFFNMTRLDTMAQVKDWYNMFCQQSTNKIPIVLGGTKVDLLKPDLMNDVVTYATKTVEQLGLECFIPTSSKTGANVDELINRVVDAVLNQLFPTKK